MGRFSSSGTIGQYVKHNYIELILFPKSKMEINGSVRTRKNKNIICVNTVLPTIFRVQNAIIDKSLISTETEKQNQ